MIINASTYTSAIPVAPSDTINIPGPKVRTSGTTSSLTDKRLVDTAANFVTTYNANGTVNNRGVSVGMIVYNMAAINTSAWEGPEVAQILEIVNNTTLRLSSNIFPVTGAPSATQDYNIYDPNQANPKGAIIQVGSAEDGTSAADIYVRTIDGDDVFISGVPLGTVLPLVVQRVMVGTAATTGRPNTETDAENIIAYI